MWAGQDRSDTPASSRLDEPHHHISDPAGHAQIARRSEILYGCGTAECEALDGTRFDGIRVQQSGSRGEHADAQFDRSDGRSTDAGGYVVERAEQRIDARGNAS